MSRLRSKVDLDTAADQIRQGWPISAHGIFRRELLEQGLRKGAFQGHHNRRFEKPLASDVGISTILIHYKKGHMILLWDGYNSHSKAIATNPSCHQLHKS